jgi:hypothetical protein
MLPVRYQRPVFRSLSGEKKLSHWEQKLQIVLQQEWDISTRSKIAELLSKLNLNLYNKPITEPPTIEWQNYLDEWERDMLGNNRIDSVQFIIHFCTLMTFDEVDKLLNHPETIDLSWLEGYKELTDVFGGGSGGSAAAADCECRYDIYCSLFLNADCATPTGGCTQVTGCGITGTSSCKGLCPENSNSN